MVSWTLIKHIDSTQQSTILDPSLSLEYNLSVKRQKFTLLLYRVCHELDRPSERPRGLPLSVSQAYISWHTGVCRRTLGAAVPFQI